MTVILILAAVIAGGGLLIYLLDRLTKTPKAPKDLKDTEDTKDPEDPEDLKEEECCGQHAVCERDSLLAAVAKGKIDYYDDEELDAYAGRPADCYTDEEAEEFREVIVTLLPEDVAGWGRSIQLRGIELPMQVRDEYLMLAAEQRFDKNRTKH